MALGQALLKILSKQYTPDSFIQKRFKRYDLSFSTDHNGDPVLLFMGTVGVNGKIKGRRYARRLVRDASGSIIKDHWDDKGPTG